ncbi:hypothetical protein [Pedobacter sp. SYP-B3415]|uniref:hypothetical protein n=1 Tax=Pedobacter sp. SYP-B3415 TaxID=2496641 RepID=UPI00101C790E|nr:hypothetical protein [Pedobacter sp. SYP-B3415]
MLQSVYLFSFSVLPVLGVVIFVSNLWYRHRNWFCLQPDRWLDEQTVYLSEQVIAKHFFRSRANAYMEIPFQGIKIGGYLSIRRSGIYTFYLKDKHTKICLRKEHGSWKPENRYPKDSFEQRFASYLGIYLETRLFS